MREGKIIRINKIFRNGKAVCVAADHGLMHGPTKEILKLEEIVREVIRGGADAVLLSPGQIKKMSHLFKGRNKPAIFARGDWISGARMSLETEFLPCYELKRAEIIEPEDALYLGADALVIYLIIGYDEEYEALNYKVCAEVGSKCRKIGLPFVIEPLVIPFVDEIPGIISPSLYEYAARMAKEIGADFLKVEYPYNMEKFKEVVKSVQIPCLILGGEKMEEKEMFKMVKDALSCDAKGIVFGRQILKSENPYRITSELVNLVHKGG